MMETTKEARHRVMMNSCLLVFYHHIHPHMVVVYFPALKFSKVLKKS